MHGGNIVGPDVAHRGAQTANELMQDFRQSSLIGNTSFNTFRYQLHGLVYIALEIAVLAAQFHGAKRTHAAIGLISPALKQNLLAGSLVGTGEHRAKHAA